MSSASLSTRLLPLAAVSALLGWTASPARCAGHARKPPGSASPAAQPSAAARAGWSERFDNGVRLSFRGVPVSCGGLVQVFSVDYSHGYYGSGESPPAVASRSMPDGVREIKSTYTFHDPPVSFRAVQEVRVPTRGPVTFSIAATWHGPAPALLEWNPVRLWAYAVRGASYRASGAGGAARSGALPVYPASTAGPANVGGGDWSRLTLAGGPLKLMFKTVRLCATPSMVLLDARRDPNVPEESVFWVGAPAIRLQPNVEARANLTLDVDPGPHMDAPPSTGTCDVPAKLSRCAAAQTGLAPLADAAGNPVIIPSPKHAEFLADQGFTPPRQWPALLHVPVGPDGDRLRQELKRFVAAIPGHVELSQAKGAASARLSVLVGTTKGMGADQPPDNPEGYLLRVDRSGVRITSASCAGAFYALQTLRQLLRLGPDGAPLFAGATVDDWPSLAFRGVHLFVGRRALPFHTKLIDRVLSRYKLNRLVLECEYTAWTSHPELRVPNDMPEPDLRAEVAHARSRFVQPIPLVNSLGHCEWLFANGQHLDLAEDTTSPHAYNASDLRVYPLLFDIYREVVDIFHPKLFHIGHDEVAVPGSTVLGRYPVRPENVKLGTTRLFAADVDKIAAWLHRRSIRPMLWADMLLSPSDGGPGGGMEAANAPDAAEASQRRRLLPRDAILCDWRYTPGSEQRNGLALFKREGRDAIGCSWYRPGNIRGWAQQAIARYALGILQTTWAGFDGGEAQLETDFDQFAAFVLAAEYSWSGVSAQPQPYGGAAHLAPGILPYDAAAVFARAYAGALPEGSEKPGWLADLSASATAGIEAGAPLLLASRGMRASRPVRKRLLTDPVAGISFLPPERCILLRSVVPLQDGTGCTAVALPQAVSVHIGARAGRLLFVHATRCGIRAGDLAAAYEVEYANGVSERIPLYYGREIQALDDPHSPDAFSTSLYRLPAWGTQDSVCLFRWTNPHPSWTIRSIWFRAGSAAAGPILFGITGVE